VIKPTGDTSSADTEVIDLVTVDLKFRRNRVENIVIILKLALVIKALSRVMGPESVDEYKVITR